MVGLSKYGRTHGLIDLTLIKFNPVSIVSLAKLRFHKLFLVTLLCGTCSCVRTSLLLRKQVSSLTFFLAVLIEKINLCETSLKIEFFQLKAPIICTKTLGPGIMAAPLGGLSLKVCGNPFGI